jgi:hypothetical protein
MVAKIQPHGHADGAAHPHQNGTAARRRALTVFSGLNAKHAQRLNFALKSPVLRHRRSGLDQTHGACGSGGGNGGSPMFSPRIEALSNSLEGLCFSIREGKARTPRKRHANRFRRRSSSNSTGILTISIPSTPKPLREIDEDMSTVDMSNAPANSPLQPTRACEEWRIDLHAPFLVRSLSTVQSS